MPRGERQKQKLLRLAQIMKRESDESHPLSAADLIKKLQEYGISAERKSIYDDMNTLQECGYDIENRRGPGGGYFLVSRPFEVAELKMLVDAVQASRFLTERKAQELMEKLEALASQYEARSLHRTVCVSGRIRTMNQTVYYTVDRIHTAITQQKQITFQYMEWVVGEDHLAVAHPRRKGAAYQVSPWALIWGNENYYLVGYDTQDAAIRHFRVDKMKQLTITEAAREGQQAFEKIDLSDYASTVFGMFGGEKQLLILQCTDTLVGPLRDRFGADTRFFEEGNGIYHVHIQAVVSPQMFGWLCGLGAGVQIIQPTEVAEQYRTYLQEILEVQENFG